MPDTVQLLASVTTTVYDPAQALVGLFTPARPPLHVYWYGAIPPETVTVADPSHVVEHVVGVVLKLSPNGDGLMILADDDEVQPFKSVTVNVYMPDTRPLIFGDVAPVDQL